MRIVQATARTGPRRVGVFQITEKKAATARRLTGDEAQTALERLQTLPDTEGGKWFDLPDEPEVSMEAIGFKKAKNRLVVGYSVRDNRQMRAVRVKLDNLHWLQAAVHRNHLVRTIKDLERRDPDVGPTTNYFEKRPPDQWDRELPTVVRIDGEMVIQDGNHRLAAQRLAGRPDAMVALTDYKDGKHYAPPEARGAGGTIRS